MHACLVPAAWHVVRRSTLSVTLTTIGLALIGMLSGCDRVENHGGRPMSYWIGELTSTDTLRRRQSAEAFAHDAPNTPEAVGALLNALATEGEADVHATLAEALSALGPDAVNAVPALSRLVRDEHLVVRLRAVSALGRIGARSTSAIPALVEALADNEHDVRAAAADALAATGPAAASATPALVALLQHDRIGWVRLRAATALGAIHSDPSRVVPALAARLAEDWPVMRIQALQSLAAYGAEAAAVSSGIEAATRDSVVEVRIAARIAARAAGSR